MSGPSTPILSRLSRLRTSVRRRLILFGLFAVGGGGIASFLTVVSLDWLLRLPAVLRIVVTVFFVTGFFAAFHHWIVRPLQARVGLQELASRLERRFPLFADGLSSTVDFLDRGGFGSPALVAEVIRSTESQLKGVRIESALTARPIVQLGLLVGGAATALSALAVISPGWIHTGLLRYVYPFGPTEWPRNTMIRPITQLATVALGESAVVAMRIERGWTESLRALLRLRQADGSEAALAMQREPDGLYTATVDAVTADLTFWFEAGDGTSENQPGLIRVVRRPEVLDAHVRIDSPAHAEVRGTRIASLMDGAVHAPIGSPIEIRIRASKAIRRSAEPDRVGLQVESGETVPLQVAEDDSQQLFARLEVAGNLRFRPELEDEEGFRNFGAPVYSILADPDRLPTLNIVSPRGDTEVTVQGSVTLVVHVEDDFGLRTLELLTERLSSDVVHRLDLMTSAAKALAEGRVKADVSHLWQPAGPNVVAGDVFILSALATDNCPSVADGQPGRSPSIRVKIISDSEFESRLRDELAAVEERIRQSALEQTDLVDRTATLVRSEDSPAALAGKELETAASLASQENRLGRRIQEIGRRVTGLVDYHRRNRPDDGEGRGRLSAMAGRIDEIATGLALPAAQDLTRVYQQTEAGPQQEALRDAAKKEAEAAERLRLLLKDVAQWGTLQSVVTRALDLVDRQSGVLTQTAKIGQATLGKTPDALSADEAAAIKKTQRQQEQIARDAEQLLARMEKLVAATSEKDPTGAEAIETALRAAASQDLVKRLASASAAIGDNRTSAATTEQKSALAALRSMLDALRERDARELENLQKQLDRAEEEVALLLREQIALKAATEKAATEPDRLGEPGREQGASRLGELGQEQSRIRRNTKSLSEEILEIDRLAAAGRLVRDAVAPMTQAEQRLHAVKPDSATLSQTEAIELLGAASEKLKEILADAEQEALLRTLNEIREELETLLEGQTAINQGIEKLLRSVETTGKLTRVEIREASRLAQQELDSRTKLNDILPDLDRVPVYESVLTRVGGWMDSVRTWLETRKIDEGALATGERIARSLRNLIAAIQRTQQLPVKTDFVERGGGDGGGEGGAMQGKAVPPVAELLVLKQLQEDVNERTRGFHREIKPENPTEKDLRELTVLSEDQKEIRRLADMLGGRAGTE